MNYIRLEALERQQADKNFSRGQVHIALKQGVLKKEPCFCGTTDTATGNGLLFCSVRYYALENI